MRFDRVRSSEGVIAACFSRFPAVLLYFSQDSGVELLYAKLLMIVLLLFLQKQNLANAIYLFGLGTLLSLSKTLRSARSADLFQKTHNVEPRLPRERVPSSTKSSPRLFVRRCVRGSFVTPRRCDAPQGPAEACFESPPSDHTPQAPASYSFKDSEVRTKCGLVPKNP